jgi:hypothetical protein
MQVVRSLESLSAKGVREAVPLLSQAKAYSSSEMILLKTVSIIFWYGKSFVNVGVDIVLPVGLKQKTEEFFIKI